MSKNIKDQSILVKGGKAIVVNVWDSNSIYMTSSEYIAHNKHFADYSFSTNAEDGTWPGSEFGDEVKQFVPVASKDADWRTATSDKEFEIAQRSGCTTRIYREHTPATVKEPVESNHFYLQSDNGFTAHVNMDPNADKETVDAVKKMIDLAYNMPATTEQAGEVDDKEFRELERRKAMDLQYDNIIDDLNLQFPDSRYLTFLYDEQAYDIMDEAYLLSEYKSKETIDSLTAENKALREALEIVQQSLLNFAGTIEQVDLLNMITNALNNK